MKKEEGRRRDLGRKNADPRLPTSVESRQLRVFSVISWAESSHITMIGPALLLTLRFIVIMLAFSAVHPAHCSVTPHH